MKLTLKELNEIYYCLDKALNLDEPNMANKELISQLKTKVWDEIDIIEYEGQSNDDDEPEYDSAGFTEDDRIVNGQYRVISNADADADYRSSLQQDEQRYENQQK
jgi:hypothetical protein